MKFWTFWKKESAGWLKYFGNYILRKMYFLKCQKPPVSQHPSRVKMLAGRKHCSNVKGFVFILIFHYSKTNWVGKHLSELDPKCKDCLLTRSRLITSIFLLVERKSRNHFKRYSLKNQKQFLIFLLHFWKVHEILDILQKSTSLMAQMVWILLTSKNVLPWISKRSCFRRPFESQIVRTSQTLLKSARNCFYPNFPLIEDKLSWKTSLSIRCKM